VPRRVSSAAGHLTGVLRVTLAAVRAAGDLQEPDLALGCAAGDSKPVPLPRAPGGRSHDLRRGLAHGDLPGHLLAETIRC
jgi:hypothetical protein